MPAPARVGAFSFDLARDAAVWHDDEIRAILADASGRLPPSPAVFEREWVHAEDRARYRAAIETCTSERRGVAVVIRIGSAETPRFVDLRLMPAEGGTVEGTAVDVTAAEATQAARAAREEMFRKLCDSSPAMLWMGDVNGGCVYLNAAQRAFWGVTGEDLSDFDWGSTLHPDDVETLQVPFTEGMARQAPFQVTARYRHADGTYRTMRTVAHPRFSDADGSFLGMVGVNVDITDQLEAERAVRASERLKDSILNAAHDAAVTVDHRGCFLEFNEAAERLFGYKRAEVIGRHMDERIIPERMRAAHQAGMKRYLSTGESRILDHRLELPAMRSDGSEFPAEITIVRIAETDPPLFTAFLRDISERKRAEEHSRMLMGELNHRTKNILSVVQAVARQTARHSSASTFAKSFSDRLMGLAASNDLLLRHNWSGVDLAELVTSQLTHLEDFIGKRILIEGPPVTIASTAAQTLGMALHELSTNSIKHGALARPEGLVRLAWRIEPDRDVPCFIMDWSESGGSGIRAPSRKGFGHSVIVDMVSAALDAKVEVEFRDEGFHWSVTAPLEKAVQG